MQDGKLDFLLLIAAFKSLPKYTQLNLPPQRQTDNTWKGPAGTLACRAANRWLRGQGQGQTECGLQTEDANSPSVLVHLN